MWTVRVCAITEPTRWRWRSGAALPFPPSRYFASLARSRSSTHRHYTALEQEARSLVADHPKLAPAHWLRGLALEQLNRLDEAAAEYEKTLEDQPRVTRGPPLRWATFTEAWDAVPMRFGLRRNSRGDRRTHGPPTRSP